MVLQIWCVVLVFVCEVSEMYKSIRVLCVPQLLSGVHKMYCLREETLPVPGRSGAHSSVALTRWQQFKEGLCSM